jgi:D-tagatose-1,6-bisphosphate aldolase subunit GatZ/KbaZ
MNVKKGQVNKLQIQLSELSKAQAVMAACTAHPLAIEAVLDYSESAGVPALIEATANQVNQFGGYTGMLPSGFVDYVNRIVDGRNCEIILGGDHLGPLVWRGLPEAEAMANSVTLIEQYVAAGFTKIHIDTSMHLKDDPQILTNEVIAARAALLCEVAESVANPENPPVYIVGSEVPIPGGAEHEEEGIAVTRPEDFLATVSAFREASSLSIPNRGTRESTTNILKRERGDLTFDNSVAEVSITKN